MIFWRLGDVGRVDGGFGPVALVLPEAKVAALPQLTAAQLADAAHGGAPSVRRRQLLAALAQRVLGVDARDVRLWCGASGQRFLREPPVFASVAWRPGWLAATIARVPVGIDVELVAEAEAARDIALAGFNGNADDLAAWHGPAGVWAAKEATLKANGLDLTSPPACWDFNGITLAAGTFAPLTMTIEPCGAAAVVALAVGI